MDSVLVEKPRIIDTIALVLDSIPDSDTLVSQTQDSIIETQGIASLQHDSLRYDTLNRERRRSIAPQRSSSAIETKVVCSASDSVWRDMNKKKI